MVQKTDSANHHYAGYQLNGPCLNLSVVYRAPGCSDWE